MYFSDNTEELFKALNEFRSKVVQPQKSAKNPFFHSNYVTLEGVIKSIDDAIQGTGLSWFQNTEVTDGQSVSISTVITHETGQYLVTGALELPAMKNDPQAFGSAITYAKRYSLATAFGIASDIDDDGNAGTQNAPAKKAPRKAPAKQQQAKPAQPTQSQADKQNHNNIMAIKKLSMKLSEIKGTPKDSWGQDYMDILGIHGVVDDKAMTTDQAKEIYNDLANTIDAEAKAQEEMAKQNQDPFNQVIGE